jgi:predicted PhzF superfamily epimerase YddE/YHI9
MQRRFRQVDVFGSAPLTGNPVAVVLDAEGLSDEQMQRLANWTNLSETTFVLAPSDPEADYRLRIFTPASELPFAGHPTLGSAHAWLEAGGAPRRATSQPADRPSATDRPPATDRSPARIVQECGASLIEMRPTADGIAFAAPPRVRSGPVEPELVDEIAAMLGIGRSEVVDAQWADNGPGWIAILLPTASHVRAIRPTMVTLPVGVVGPDEDGGPADFEVRAFFPFGERTIEDPVTGSLNASIAQWLLESGRARSPYVAAQGTVLGRAGRVFVEASEGQVWVGGVTVTCVTGTIEL